MMVTGAPSAFGDLLRYYRQSAGLTQQQLAEQAGLSVHGIQKLERGATHPYRDTARRLIAALHLEGERKSRFEATVGPVHRRAAVPNASTHADQHHNLPVPLTSLVGRDDATRDLVRQLGRTRLLTLTGVGGCGKTRLALEAARAAIDDYADGVWLVELGPLADPALVGPHVATVLRVRETAEQTLEAALVNALRQRTTLLVLDNCEHVLDACAQVIDVLLKACPNLVVLTTSREPLGIVGEAVWRVPSLALPDAPSPMDLEELLRTPAVHLFVERATAVQPRFALTTRNASVVVEVCRRLDGIPLALELAAARVESLTVEQIAQRLDQRFRLLTGASRAAVPRQQTLSATLEWSYQLLRGSERRVFERLAVFSGGWTLEAAEAVCAGDELLREDVVDVLWQLTRKSLVVADETSDGSERYSMLETVRQYARQKLSARTPDIRIEALARVEADYDNVRAVLGWWRESGRAASAMRVAIRLGGVWEMRGLYTECRKVLLGLLDLADQQARDDRSAPLDADDLTGDERACAIATIGISSLRQGDYQGARTWLTEAAGVWRESGDDLKLAGCLAEVGLATWLGGDAEAAMDHLEESWLLFKRAGSDPFFSGRGYNALRSLGMVARSRGEYRRAAEYFQQSIDRAYVSGGYTVARSLSHLGRTLCLNGDRAQARRTFHKALQILQTERIAGHSYADCLDWVAALVDSDGRPRDAAILFGAADAQWQASGAVRYAPERAAYAADLASIQSKLSGDEFATAWTLRHGLSREQAVAYALECVDDKLAATSVLRSSPR
jgi:predicted ATPase/DNA-binding XRE family transcriptional regulator